MFLHALSVSRKAWGWSEVAYAGHQGRHLGLKRHFRWALRAALDPQVAEGWFAWLERPEVRPFAAANPRLVFRPLGAYLSGDWGVARRIEVLQHTYAFLNAQGGLLREAMLRPEGVDLVRLGLDKGGEVVVRIGFNNQFRKEGEFGVFLHLSPEEPAISSFAFSLDFQPGEGWVMLVGAVQGRKGEEDVKAATKALHGLRPKQMMVVLAQEIARCLRLARIIGAGNRCQVFRGASLMPRGRKRTIRFDYDAFWAEMEATPRPDGWFDVPLKTPRRSPEEMKPNKRSMYAKRYAFLDALSRQLRTILTPFPRG